jgi:hypothetical protein
MTLNKLLIYEAGVETQHDETSSLQLISSQVFHAREEDGIET